MLALVADVLKDGPIKGTTGGAANALRSTYWMGEVQIQKYVEITEKLKSNDLSWHADWVLQELGNDWMTEYPTASEALVYVINADYVQTLIDKVRAGDKSGKSLEYLAQSLLLAMTGAALREGC